jgi:SAM-dependent methyltransferase
VVGVDLNPGMLSVARSVISTDGPLHWQEASADMLPFPDGSFDVVYCQLGLQFFADRAAALREMRRVLDAEGRLALMVWQGIHESPGYAALAEALDRHVGQAAAAIMLAPFGLSNATNWRLSFVPPVFRPLQFNSGLGPCAFLRSSDLC